MAEAEITGGLEHPGVVPVYGLGHDPQHGPYYAMRFIKGASLKDAIDAFHNKPSGGPRHDPATRSLELRKLLGRFVAVCEAIAYAHSRGVIHRDIKPANIMLGKFGETLVVDWGLAKAVGRDDVIAQVNPEELTLRPSSGSGGQHTLPGSALGTPAYMSPEQAAGDLDHVGPASDIYSLGATLYTILTGRPAIQPQPDIQAVLDAVRRGDFPPPRSVRPEVDRRLEAICQKAMARHPDDRYLLAQDFARDIEHWMADELVSAYPEGVGARLGRWSRRNRAWIRSAAAALVIVVISTAGFAVRERQIAGRERQARTVAQTRLEHIEKSNDLLASIFQDLDPRVKQKDSQDLHALLGDRLEEAASQLDALNADDPLTVAKLQRALGICLLNLGYPAKALEARIKLPSDAARSARPRPSRHAGKRQHPCQGLCGSRLLERVNRAQPGNAQDPNREVWT